MVSSPEQTRLKLLEAENEALKLDSLLKNLATGLGSLTGDKRLANVVQPPTHLDHREIDSWFESNKYAAKLITVPVEYSTRKWCIYSLTDDLDDRGEVTQAMQKLIDSVAPIFTEALSTALKYGGSAIVIGALDGIEDPSQPLNKDRLKSLKLIRVAEAGVSQELQVARWGENPLEADYNLPIMYQFVSSEVAFVHPSRLILFNGIDVGARRSREQYNGFGAPLLQRCIGELRDFTSSVDAIALSLQDFNRLVVKLKGLVDLIGAKKKKEVEERLKLYQYTSSVMSAFVGDPDDQIEYLNRSFQGVREMLEVLKMDLGACAIEPHTTFFNESPSGNTSGTDQMRNINSQIANFQEKAIRKQIEYLIDLWHHCQDSPTKGQPPESYELTFPVVYELNEIERAALEKTQAERMAILLKGNGNEGVINPLEAAEAIARDVPLSSVIDLDARQKAAAEAAKELAEFETEGLVIRKPEPTEDDSLPAS
jgi:phage-related protein (TIGR01555 family)